MKSLFCAIALLLFSLPLQGAVIQRIDVDPASLREEVLPMLPVREGDSFEESLVGISKRLLETSEAFERVEVSWDQRHQTLLIKVSPKHVFEEILWEGDSVSNIADIQRACISFREPQALTQERLTQMSRCLHDQIQAQGYLDASVIIDPQGKNLILRVSRGEPYTVSSIRFEGGKSADSERLQNLLTNRVGRRFRPLSLDADTRALTRYFLNRGYFFVEVFKPQVEVNTITKEVALEWRIRERRRYEVEFDGDFRDDSMLDSLIERDEAFPRWFVDELVDDVRAHLREEGHLRAEVEAVQKRNKEGIEVVTIRSKAGPLFYLGEPEWIGAADKQELQKLYDKTELRAGRDFHENKFRDVINEEFYNRLLESGYLEAEIKGIDFVVDDEKAIVRPIIFINEGDRFFIESVTFKNVPSQLANLQEAKDLRRAVKVGNVFNPKEIDQLQLAWLQAITGSGYLDAELVRDVQKDRGKLKVTYELNAGPQYRVASILIRGIKHTKLGVLQREVIMKVGDIYTEDLVRESVAHLFRLGMARSVDFRIVERDPKKGLAYVLVEVIESSRFRFEFGPGYGTLDGFRGVFKGTIANIGGTARRITLYAKANRVLGESKVPTDPNILNPKETPFIERRISLEYFEPTIFGLPVDGRIVLTHSKEDKPKLDLFKNAFTFAIDYRFSRHWIWTTHFEVEFSDPFNIQKDQTQQRTTQQRLHSIGEELNINYVDDTFDPRRGWRARLTFDLFEKKLGGDSNFWQATIRKDFFRPLYTFQKGRSIGSAFSLNVGFSDAYGQTHEVPVEKRFFIGGENSVRGFAEDSINPVGQLGGYSYFYVRSEFNFPLIWGIDLLGFLDAGNAFRDNHHFRPWDLRYGGGGGLRWNTPVGPLKIGYGFILDRKPGEPIGHFYLGVGAI